MSNEYNQIHLLSDDENAQVQKLMDGGLSFREAYVKQKKLTGGVWRTINGAKVYIAGGKIMAGPGAGSGLDGGIKMTNKEINKELESAYQYVQSAIGTLEMLREDQGFAGTKAIEDKLHTLQRKIDNLEIKNEISN
jgi:hypothetical protein